MRDEKLVKSIKNLHVAFDADLTEAKLTTWLDSIPWNWDERRFEEAVNKAIAGEKRCPAFARIKELYLTTKQTGDVVRYAECTRCDGYGRVFVRKGNNEALCRCDLCDNGKTCFPQTMKVRYWSTAMADEGYEIR